MTAAGQVVVVGDGMVGARFAEELRAAGPRATGSRSPWSGAEQYAPTTGSCSPTCSPAGRVRRGGR